MPLFGDGLGLDSVDALELVLALEKEYGFEIQPHESGQSRLHLGQQPGQLRRRARLEGVERRRPIQDGS